MWGRSIIDWLQLIAVVELLHLAVSTAVLVAVVRLFKQHDGSVLQKLEHFIRVVEDRL